MFNKKEYDLQYHKLHRKTSTKESKEKRKDYDKKYRKEHKKQILERGKIYYHQNKEKFNERYPRLREELLDLLGRKCQRCGYDFDTRALHIDHIQADGYLERKGHGILKIYKTIIENIKLGKNNYQVLCANCNFLKNYSEDRVSRSHE